MLSDALRDLKLDRRLATRRGWVSPEELAKGLASLPDVADKKAETPPPAPESPEKP